MKNKIDKQKVDKEEMERYTLYLPKSTAEKMRAIGSKNRRTTAWIIREYCVEAAKSQEINKKIGLVI